MDADPLPEDTRQQLIAAQAAVQALLDFECCEDSAGGAAYEQSKAADTCIEALIATIAVLGDVSFGDIRNISFRGEGQGLGEPDMFDSPASSEHSSRGSRHSSRHSSDDVAMGIQGPETDSCSCEPQCEPAGSDTPHGSQGFNCELEFMWERHGRSITPAQREHCPAD
jgi:hypothetical protein